MPLRLHDTLERRLVDFTPLDPSGPVTFYTCGPTVYDYAHIGNFRSFLNADVLRRTLEFLGHDVRHVMNITDVGHMTEDAVADGGGEDKMAVAGKRLLEAKKSGSLPDGAEIDPGDPGAIADFYAAAFIDDARLLGLKVVEDADSEPALMPRPTRWVPEMIALIERLIAGDHAYVGGDGAVYFSVASFPDYGRLSGNTIDALREGEGGRVNAANQAAKRHPADFLLWKPDPSHLMRWPSPWGEGYPGWHLECSAMAQGLLAPSEGEHAGEIDLHSGGEDNIFPHHECEIAQSRAASGSSRFARYWFHTRHLVVEGEKMSKSKGNFFTVRDILAKGATPAALRLELVRTHYRQNANFTLQGLRDCGRMIDRWCRLESQLASGQVVAGDGPGPLESALPGFTDAVSDDLNLARAIGVLNEAVNASRVDADSPGDPARAASELAALRRMNDVLGVLERNDAPVVVDDDLAGRVEACIAARADAKANKDWAAADAIRDELTTLGVAIKDGPEGTTWSRIVE
ncbi:MAG: cysteine--tRNA ligase [Phycisphaerales bacterium]|nr:cysteine--tRNA ligase [Phycisphaerales bacterium]